LTKAGAKAMKQASMAASKNGSSSNSSSSSSSRDHSENKDVLLADLYRPPLEIMFTGSFQAAKEYAKKDNKWILFNLQDEREFDSMLLNRDTFGNETLKVKFHVEDIR
jgi:UBX domain-containing protein 7